VKVALVLSANGLKVSSEIGFHDRWKHRHAILIALATADHDLVPREVNVLDAQAAAFEQTQAGPVEQRRHEPWHAGQRSQHRGDLFAGQNDRQSLGTLGPHDVVQPRQVKLQDVAIEE
jgi:hypothetical protein